MKKHDYEFVKNYFANDGYELLSKVYVNAMSKLNIVCPSGHEYEVCFNSFKNGNRCPECAGNKKHSFEYVKKYYGDRNYLYLSTTYTNALTKELVQCPEGHQYKVVFSSFQRGSRCPECAGNKKLTYEDVKNYFANGGYELLSKVYVNALTKLSIKCHEGHEYEVCFNSFKNGNRCPECAGNKKLTYEFVKKYFESKSYIYLSTTYTNVVTKELVQCPEGHQYEVRFGNFKRGDRCAVCAGNKKHDYEFVKKYFENDGYELLSKVYVNALTKLSVKCPSEHEHEVSFNSFKNSNRRCPICNNEKTSSKAEIEIQEFVKTLTNTVVICNDRSQILNPETGWFLELDIYLPDLKKAIEYNGTYWHSSKEAKIRDQMKIKQCKNLNIDLLIINEADYINNNKEILSKIKNFIGL